MQAAWNAGRFDVDRFLTEVESEQFDEFVAMNRVVPFGDEKVCRVFALGVATICNLIVACGPGGKDIPEFKPEDFIPWKVRKKKREYINPNAAAAAATMALRQLQES